MNHQAIILTHQLDNLTDQDTLIEAVNDFLVKKHQLNLNVAHCIRVMPVDEKTSIGIKQVRQLILDLSFGTDQQTLRSIIIYHAHTLTHEAQNALLKILEEPPGNTLIVLTTNKPNNLLSTIHSRCQLIHLQQPKKTQKQNILPSVKTYSEAVSLAEQNKSKPDAIMLVRKFAISSTLTSSQREMAVRAINHLESNSNTRLTLEHFLFQLPSPSQ